MERPFQVGDLVTWTAEYGRCEQITFIVIKLSPPKYSWSELDIEGLSTDGELITLCLPDPCIKMISHAPQTTDR